MNSKDAGRPRLLHCHRGRCVFIYNLNVQYLSFKSLPQHDSWRWHPLIAQVLAGKSKAMPQLHSSLQSSKNTKKNNQVPYNMRCWKCCPSSSTHFWHLFRKCAFTQIDSISETQSISCLIFAFSSSNVWRFAIFFYGGTWKIKCVHEPPHIRETESKYQAWIWLCFGRWINASNCTFPKKMPELFE